MIGVSGIISFKLPFEELRQQAGRFDTGLLSKILKFSTHMNKNIFANYYDEDLTGCVSIQNGILAILVGDIYEDDLVDLSKSEYILRLFKQKGVDACVKLNGSYSFIILDTGKKKAYLGTDENSFIPIYYTYLDGSLYFSWNISDFSRIFQKRISVNYSGVLSWLLAGPVGFNEETRLEGIKRLDPGAFVVISEKGCKTKQGKPSFYYEPCRDSEEKLLDEAEEILRMAIRRRIGHRGRVAIGLSGGIDSRMVFAAGKKDFGGEWICYTYGRPDFLERDIAGNIARYYGQRHVPIVFDDLMYIDFAKDGVFYAGCGSLFKHGVQLHLSATLKRKYRPEGILLGSALDLSLGSSHTPESLYDLTSRDSLLTFYRKRHFLFGRKEFKSFLKDPSISDKIYGNSTELVRSTIKRIPGKHLSDINIAYVFDTRVRRWYNRNLIYHLYSHRLITPTYDRDFLKMISKIPWKLRHNSSFRHKLLNRIDKGVAAFPESATTQPANMPRDYADRFKRLLSKIDREKQKVWFASKGRVYLPSNRYEANFMESFRVYPAYQKFLKRTLLGKDSCLIGNYFKRNKIEDLITAHVSGKQNNHKFLIMLVSAELACRILERGETGVSRENMDFSKYIKGGSND